MRHGAGRATARGRAINNVVMVVRMVVGAEGNSHAPPRARVKGLHVHLNRAEVVSVIGEVSLGLMATASWTCGIPVAV